MILCTFPGNAPPPPLSELTYSTFLLLQWYTCMRAEQRCRAGIVQWCKHLPPKNVAHIWILDLSSCGLTLLLVVVPTTIVFFWVHWLPPPPPPFPKNQHQLSKFCFDLETESQRLGPDEMPKQKTKKILKTNGWTLWIYWLIFEPFTTFTMVNEYCEIDYTSANSITLCRFHWSNQIATVLRKAIIERKLSKNLIAKSFVQVGQCLLLCVLTS